MARGQMAKIEVENIIRNAFGKNFLGVDTSSKKIYVQAPEGGEMVNIALTLTCPKTPFTPGSSEPSAFNNENFGQPDIFHPAEITQEEMDNIKRLEREFNL